MTNPSNDSFNDYTKNNIIVGSQWEKDVMLYFGTKQVIMDLKFFKIGFLEFENKQIELLGVFGGWMPINVSSTK